VDTQRLLLHPVRLRFVSAVLDGRRFTTSDLARRVPDVSSATLYRQLAILVDGGLVEVVSEERVRGAVKRTYQLVRRRPLLDGEDTSAMSGEEHRELLSSLATAMLAEFGRFVSEPDADRSASSYRQFALWLTDDERGELWGEIDAVIARYSKPVPGLGRRIHLLTNVLFPQSIGAD
jgi:DNA-binding transcriptional ArsR family regulator